jgi:hypothetical protein
MSALTPFLVCPGLRAAFQGTCLPCGLRSTTRLRHVGFVRSLRHRPKCGIDPSSHSLDVPDVDIVRNVVDQPQYYEETYPSIQLAYVVSLAGASLARHTHALSPQHGWRMSNGHLCSVRAERSLSVRDVTRRYTSRWSEVTQRRIPDQDWWNQTLSFISRPTDAMLVHPPPL